MDQEETFNLVNDLTALCEIALTIKVNIDPTSVSLASFSEDIRNFGHRLFNVWMGIGKDCIESASTNQKGFTLAHLPALCDILIEVKYPSYFFRNRKICFCLQYLLLNSSFLIFCFVYFHNSW